MHVRVFTPALAVIAGAWFCANAAHAQQPAAPQPDYLAALKSCQAVATDAERLACFDRAVATMVTAADGGEVRLVDQEEVRKTRRRLFGFSLPDIGLFGDNDGEDDELDTLQSTITSVRYSRSDAFTFQIEEGGATWQVSNAPARLRPVKPGDKVEFKKAALGSYFIRINGQIGVKGRRVQ
jgi:hypothetical protein